MMAMVEQRKSLPQAVPSSICITGSCQPFGPSKVSSRELLLRALEYQCPPEPVSKLLRKTCDIFSFLSIRCKTYVVAGEVVDGSLAEHGVVLELRLAERGGVAGNDDELGLAGAEGLEGGLVTKSDLAGLL